MVLDGLRSSQCILVHIRLLRVDSDQSQAYLVHSELCVGWDGMVIVENLCISEASLHFRRPAPTWSMRKRVTYRASPKYRLISIFHSVKKMHISSRHTHNLYLEMPYVHCCPQTPAQSGSLSSGVELEMYNARKINKIEYITRTTIATTKCPFCYYFWSKHRRPQFKVSTPFLECQVAYLRKLGKICRWRSGGSNSRDWVWFCLLYTSPSPRDATLSRMPSSA